MERQYSIFVPYIGVLMCHLLPFCLPHSRFFLKIISRPATGSETSFWKWLLFIRSSVVVRLALCLQKESVNRSFFFFKTFPKNIARFLGLATVFALNNQLICLANCTDRHCDVTWNTKRDMLNSRRALAASGLNRRSHQLITLYNIECSV